MITITKTITQPQQAIEEFDATSDQPPMVDNPDYVAQVGDPTMPNPQTRIEFVSEKFDELATDFFAQFAKRAADIAAKESAKQQVELSKQAIKATINTQM